MANLLFICSKNQWRSPTAELLFKNHPEHNARSAGTSEKARVKVTQKLIDWADNIFVMESRHKELLQERFFIVNKFIEVLDIPDEYQFGDEELVNILKVSLHDYL